jgi:glycosyltransferase involved in cell wall biosynthesis
MHRSPSKDRDLMTSNNAVGDRPLQIILEGRLFEEQALGGISRIYHEILPRMCDIDKRILFSILTSGRLMQSLPKHAQIASYASRFPAHRLLRPQTLFWRLQDYLRAKLQIASFDVGRKAIWHATYFQMPTGWKGPKVVSVYDLIPEKYPHFFDKGYDNILRERKKHAILAADKVICISESVRSDVLKTYDLPEERAVAVPLACGEIFRQMSGADITADFRVDRPFILYVGMRHHYKNFRTLLSAYAAWPRRNEIGFLVVGDPWSKEEQKEITAAGLESNILCRPGIPDEELCALYNQALAFVYPSLSEGFGIPLLEAMACGCQIAASRIPAFMEVAGDVPHFFDPLNKDELIAALEAACFSERTKIRRDDILARYSWDHNAHTTLKIYRELAACD